MLTSRSSSFMPLFPTTEQQLWIRSVDSVLHNRTAFDAFHNWLSSNPGQEEHCRQGLPLDALELYLAILAHRKCLAEQDPKSRQMALALHRRFISPKSGTCWFVPMEVRKAVSHKVHCGELTSHMFDECLPHVWSHLCQQHALFVCSSHFSQLSNKLMYGQGVPTSSTLHYIPRLSNLQELSNIKKAHTNTCISTPTHTSTTCSRLYRLGARRRGTEQTAPFPTQRLYPMSNRARTSTQPRSEIVSQTRRFQRQQMVLGQNIQLQHQRLEDRQEFAHSLENRLNQLIGQVRLKEEETGDTIFLRDLHSNNNRQMCAWDEDDTLPPELSCEWMRNSGVQQKQPDTNLAICLPSYYCKAEQDIHSPPSIHHYLGPKYYESEQPFNAPSSQQHQFLRQPTLIASSGSYGHYNDTIRHSDSSGFCSSDSAAYIQYGQREAAEESRRTAGKNRQKGDGAATTSNTNVMVMSYRETNGVPFVAKLLGEESRKVTFKDFRRQFGISSRTNKRFLFKSPCEDDSAPFQWTVANEDDMLLPVFEGRITAECRSTSEFN